MSPRAQTAVDGRLRRSVRSRLAICEACLDLVQEGVLQPNADQIAERARLSRRSIFNHFGDLSEIYDSVVEVGMQRCQPLQREVSPELPIAERVELWTDARAKFLEATAPFARALTAQALAEATREQALRVGRKALQLQQQEVERLFRNDLAQLEPSEQQELLEAIAASTSPLAWEHLRQSRGISMPRARVIMRRTVAALLRDAGGELPH